MTLPPVIQTRTGKLVDLLDPKPESICIDDIAHHLSRLCRYTGATRDVYSVAQHSCLVSDSLPPRLQLHGLLHDAAEAYLGDISRPQKALLYHSRLHGAFIPYSFLEGCMLRTIYAALGIPAYSMQDRKAVANADMAVFVAEVRDLMPGPFDSAVWGFQDFRTASHIETIKTWPVEVAREAYMARYCRLKMEGC